MPRRDVIRFARRASPRSGASREVVCDVKCSPEVKWRSACAFTSNFVYGLNRSAALAP
jgi:hypothetical protein